MTYPYRHAITTRWDDNDVYGHVNNVRFFAFSDRAARRPVAIPDCMQAALERLTVTA